MHDFLFYLALLALLSVLVVLIIGVYSLVRGGGFRERWSNKLMRLRVLLQFVAIVILMLFVWWTQNRG